MRNLFSRSLTIVVLAIMFMAQNAYAHGDAPSFEKEVGSILIDIGYDAVGFRPGEEVTFDFDIFNQSGAVAFEPFDEVRVAIAGEGENFSQTVVNDGVMIPTLKYIFPKEGEYTLATDFIRSGSSVAQGEFPIQVGEHDGAIGRFMNTLNYVIAIVLVAIAGFVIVRSFIKRS